MYNVFDHASAELTRIDEQLRDVTTIASESENQVSASVAEVLAHAKLEQYFQLCTLVEKEPSFIQIYAGALQRVEVIQFLIDRTDESELSAVATSTLGRLAIGHETEKRNLEAFFTLFAPEHPDFVAYNALGSKLIPDEDGAESQIVNHHAEADAPDLQPDVELNVTPTKTQQEPVAPKTESERRRTSEITPDQPAVYVNGNLADLSNLEAHVLILASKKQGDSTKLKTKDFIDDEIFIEIVHGLAGREITRSGRSQRFQKTVSTLNELFPGMFSQGGVKGGAWYQFNGAAYDITADEEHSSALHTPEEPTQPSVEAQPVIAIVDEITDQTQPEVVEQGAAPAPQSPQSNEKTRLSPHTRLLPEGFMIERRMIPYAGLEKPILHIINSAPRKAPYSPAHIASCLGAQGLMTDASEVTECLKNLQIKLPEGWLIKISGGKQKPDGWRFGSGVRIRMQHGRNTSGRR